MYFITTLLWYAFKFIFLLAVSVGGVFLGICLRKNKNEKMKYINK